MNYTLILYKPDGCTTSRGCVMDQWGSDFSMDVDISEDDALNKIASTFYNEHDGSYEAHIIGVIEE